MHPADEQDLVVHRQPEHDREQDHRDARVQRLRREAEQAGEVSLLEDEHQRAERCADREEVQQDRLQRKDHRAGQQEEQNVGHQYNGADRQRDLVVDELDHVDIDRRCAADQHLPPGHALVVADRLQDVARGVRALIYVARCLDQDDVLADRAGKKLLGRSRNLARVARVELLVLGKAEVRVEVVDRARVQDPGNRRDAPCQGVLVRDPIACQRRPVRIVDHDVERGLALAGEVGDQPVISLPRLKPRGQHVDVAVGETKLQERCRRDDQEGDRWHEHDDRPLHDPGRERSPETAPARRSLRPRDAQPVDRGPDHRKGRGQDRQRVEHRDGHDDRARGAHRGHERALEEKHRGQADGNCEAGERDRAAGRGHRGRDRVLAAGAGGQLVPKTVDDEQRVVDRDPESDQRHDVDRVLRYVGEMVQQERAADPSDDRQDANAEGKPGRDHRRKDEDKQ